MYISRIDIRLARGIRGGNVLNLCNTAASNFQGVDLSNKAIFLINTLIIKSIEFPCRLVIDVRITSFVRRDVIHRRSLNGGGIRNGCQHQSNEKK